MGDRFIPYGTICSTFEALFIHNMEKNWALLTDQCRTADVAVVSVSAAHTSQVSWIRN